MYGEGQIHILYFRIYLIIYSPKFLLQFPCEVFTRNVDENYSYVTKLYLSPRSFAA